MFPYLSHVDVASDALEVDDSNGNNACGTLYFPTEDVVYPPSQYTYGIQPLLWLFLHLELVT